MKDSIFTCSGLMRRFRPKLRGAVAWGAASLFLWLGPADAVAQWASGSAVNTPVAVAAGYQQSASAISDGAGGTIIVWGDTRSGDHDLYAQRFDSSGVAQWAANGVEVCTATLMQYTPKLVSDGSGGAIIQWTDYRAGRYDIYAQRIDSSGNLLWTANGVGVCTAANDQEWGQLISDGAGGAILTWSDSRASNYDIYAQRLNSSGAALWTAGGVPVCNTTAGQYSPQLMTDGASGAIITWADDRSGNYDIYVQWLNSSGTKQWSTDGALVCAATGHQSVPQLVSDGAGGAIITWEDGRVFPYGDIYAQRVNSSGATQWTANGVAVCSAADFQTTPQATPDGAGGAIISWSDRRGGTHYDIYAQRINPSGVAQWTANGLAVCTAAYNQQAQKQIEDGANGVILVWQDRRNSDVGDIYTQRLNSSGTALWTSGGTPVCTAAGIQDVPVLVGAGTGSAIQIWQDNRNSDTDLYASFVQSNGVLLPVALSRFEAE